MLKLGLRVKLIILVLVVLIPLIVLQVVRINYQYEESVEAELKSSEHFAQTVSLNFMNYLQENWTQQYALGLSILRNPHWNNKEMEDYMNSVISEKRTIKGYSWISTEGLVLVSSNSDVEGQSVRDMEFYKRIKNGEVKVVSNLIKSIVDDDVIFHIARGIHDGEGLRGIMLAVVSADQLNNIFTVQAGKDESSFGLVDSSGMLVYRYRDGAPKVPYEKRKMHSSLPIQRALKGETVKVYSTISQFHGDHRMGVFYPISEIGWACFANKPVNKVLGMLVTNAKKDITVLIMVSIVSLLLAVLLGNRYVNSLNKLRYAADEVSKGNLTVRTELAGGDEAAATSLAFNRMAEEINNQITQRDEYTRLKSRFFSIVSHELKTPLNIILGAIQLIENMDKVDKISISKYLSMQKQNSYRLLRLINNIIDINRMEGNHFTVKPVNCDIVRVVEDITISVAEYTELKNISIIFDTDVEEKITAVDPDKIERVMLNLLSNAIKFTEPGGKIQVNMYDKGDKVKISVKDTGIGIPKDMFQKIFEYFTQVDDTLRRKAEGSGIGLSLVKWIVDMHGGAISVNSVLGKGSEFIVELPVKLIDSGDTLEEEKSIANVERINIEFSDIYM
jgi:signal transduction histidine kinase